MVIPSASVSSAQADHSGTLGKQRPQTPQHPKWEDDIDFGEHIVFDQTATKPKPPPPPPPPSSDPWSRAISPDPVLFKQTQPLAQSNYSSQPHQSSKMSIASSDAEDVEERPQVGVGGASFVSRLHRSFGNKRHSF